MGAVMGPAHERLERLYDDHGAAVLAFARRRTTAALADEVLSETFLVAWRRLADVPGGAERPWLLAVARRVLANQRRGQRRRDALGERLDLHEDRRDLVADDDPGPDVHGALAALPERQREVVRLVFWDDLTPAEAATVLGTTSLAVRARLHRALRTLRAELTLADERPAAPRPLPTTGGRHARP
jgi:RNA polymerase sigma-70 factor (ECF subfamily)